MTTFNQNKKSNHLMAGPRIGSSKDTATKNREPLDLFIDPHLLVKRVNALAFHASEIGGEEMADNYAREISTHMKSLKEIMAHNDALKARQDKKAYTRYEDLPPPRPEDIEAYRKRIEAIITQVSHTDTMDDS